MAFIVIHQDGEFITRSVTAPSRRAVHPSKRQLSHWAPLCLAQAKRWKATECLFRFEGRWHLLHVRDTLWPKPDKSFPNRDAAEMWMIHHG